MKAGVIGAGRFGRNHVRTLHEMEALHSVAELNDTAREDIADEFKVQVYKDYQELLATDVPAVSITTPAPSHYQIAKDAILAGKHVLVEKPMVLDPAQGEELVKLAEERGVVLMVGHLLIYQPAIRWIKDALNRGLIGRVRSLHQERLNLGKARDHENALWSLGVHDVAVALYLIGKAPTEVQFCGQGILNEGVEDDTYLHMKFDGGVQAHIHSSWYMPELRRHLVIVGEHGMLVFDEPNKQVIHHDKSIDRETLANINEGAEVVFNGDGQPLQIELEHFLDCAKEGMAPLSDGRTAVDVLKVLHKASPQV